MPDPFYIGSENEIRQVKIEKWPLNGDGSLSQAMPPQAAYDENIALTHPKYIRLGLDLLTIALDHEANNTGEPEIKSGPTVPGSNEFKAVLAAQKILTKAFADLSALHRDKPQHGSIKTKRLVARDLVLAEYNQRLGAEAKRNSFSGNLLKCKLYTVEDLIQQMEEYIDSLGYGILHEPEASAQLAHLQDVQTDHGNATGGSYFFKLPSGGLQSGTQASFEVPVVRIGKIGTQQKKGFENAFEKAPAAPSKTPNEANHFVFARTTAHELVAGILALPSAPLLGSPTLQTASGVTDEGIQLIRSIFTIFFFNRMIGLSDPKSWRWDSGAQGFTANTNHALVLSTEKDKYGLLFKTSPDDLIRQTLDAQARSLLERFAAHASRQTLLEQMCRKLVDQNASSKGKSSVVKAAWAADLAGFAVHQLMPRVRGRYPNETAMNYGTQLNRNAADSTDLASGKPLPVRRQPAGTIAMVVEARSSNHRYSVLMATNPRVAVNVDTTKALQELKHFQAV